MGLTRFRIQCRCRRVIINSVMNPLINQWGAVAVIVGGYLLGIYFQNRRIDDLRDSINRRFDDVRELLKSEVNRLESSINRLESEIKRLDERFDRLEHPIVRPS